ncbi:MAG: hypothetical protein PHC28_07990 [Flavobacterium sp.]|uniref:hypothetical protein n=1 Tax=Flavobacterium sp. TaxID=239 RepID=UPI00261AC508|nr:hypothetical protein [Flavobacterium sp.]MDD5150411.1 hypothetical protein [Flavobacterium sp.]
MNNQQVAPSELYSTKITIFYKQFTPNGAISVPSGHTVCGKSESSKTSSRGANCQYMSQTLSSEFYLCFLSDNNVFRYSF